MKMLKHLDQLLVWLPVCVSLALRCVDQICEGQPFSSLISIYNLRVCLFPTIWGIFAFLVVRSRQKVCFEVSDLWRGRENKSVGNVGVTFEDTNVFGSVRFYNVDAWAIGTQLRRHICHYRFKHFVEKNVEGFCFGECTSPEVPSDWRDSRWWVPNVFLRIPHWTYWRTSVILLVLL